jgi:hypothetical protein
LAVVEESSSPEDWRSRIRALIAFTGAADPAAWAERNPVASFSELAASLAPDIAAIQVEQILREDAEHRDKLDHFARTCLVRYLRQRMPLGWGGTLNDNFCLARAFASWSAALGDEFDQQVDAVWRALNIAGVMPRGWLPKDANDNVIGTIFSGINFK